MLQLVGRHGDASRWRLRRARTEETRIAAADRQGAALPTFIGARIDFISRALLGSRYIGHTLIGGPRKPEQFVLRDDAFDCVTFCETVLAAARARTAGRFRGRSCAGSAIATARSTGARAITISPTGACNNIANGICRAVVLPARRWSTRRSTYMPVCRSSASR